MATYTKLKDGNWGIRVEGQTASGASIVVRKKDGATKVEIVGKVIWTDGKVSLCTIAKAEAETKSSKPKIRSAGRSVCRHCGGPLVNARHHTAMDGLCGSCAFDEYDC